MFELTEECFLWFEGTDAPAAMVEVAVLGGLDAADCEALTEEGLARGFRGAANTNAPHLCQVFTGALLGLRRQNL